MSSSFIEAFIITNGRSSFKYCLKSIENQTLSVPIRVIGDMSCVDANNKALVECRSNFYFKIDDDFILNKYAFEFMNNVLQCRRGADRVIMYDCRLWEDFTKKVIRGLKVYNTELSKSIGGFSVNKLGKIDKPFTKKIEKSGLRTIRDKSSIVGIHSCPPWEDQIKYEHLWTKNATVKHRKTTRSSMKRYDKDLSYQYSLSDDFLINLNRKKKTKFHRFIRNRM